ncbi:MAG: hypothetical protein NVS3B7_12470 [Candidatus Elarobacter sp.]
MRRQALDAAIDTAARDRWDGNDDERLARALRVPVASRRTRVSLLATMDEIVDAVGVEGQERYRAPDAVGPPSGIFWGCGCVASRAPAAETFVWLRCDQHRVAALV